MLIQQKPLLVWRPSLYVSCRWPRNLATGWCHFVVNKTPVVWPMQFCLTQKSTSFRWDISWYQVCDDFDAKWYAKSEKRSLARLSLWFVTEVPLEQRHAVQLLATKNRHSSGERYRLVDLEPGHVQLRGSKCDMHWYRLIGMDSMDWYHTFWDWWVCDTHAQLNFNRLPPLCSDPGMERCRLNLHQVWTSEWCAVNVFGCLRLKFGSRFVGLWWFIVIQMHLFRLGAILTQLFLPWLMRTCIELDWIELRWASISMWQKPLGPCLEQDSLTTLLMNSDDLVRACSMDSQNG